MAQLIETDIRLLPVAGTDQDIQPYSGGVRVLVELSRAPSDEWRRSFEEAVKSSITPADQMAQTAQMKLDVRGNRTWVSFVAVNSNAEALLERSKKLTAAANEIAKKKNEKQADLELRNQAAHQEAHAIAAAVRERLRGK